MAGRRRRRPLRGREPRRPLDRRLRRLRQHELLRHQHRDGHGPPPRDRPRRPHRHRRGVRLGRGRARRRRPTRSSPGRRTRRRRPGSDLIALSYHHTHGAARHGHPLHQQLRAVPVPREGHPAVHHQPARRRHGPALRRRAQRARLALRRRPLRRRRTSCSHEGAPGEIYNIGAGNETPNRVLVDKLLALLGKDESSVDYVDDRLGHDRRYSVDIAKITALGWTKRRTLDEALDEHRRLVPRQRVVVAAAQGRRAEPDAGPDHRRRRASSAPTSCCTCDGGGRRGDRLRPGRARPRRPRLGATRPSSASRPDVVLHAGRLDGGRRLRDAIPTGPSASTRWARGGWPTPPAGPAPTWCTCRTDYVFDGTKAEPYARVGPTQPAVGLRPVEAGRRARGRGARAGHASCARRGCAAPTATTW